MNMTSSSNIDCLQQQKTTPNNYFWIDNMVIKVVQNQNELNFNGIVRHCYAYRRHNCTLDRCKGCSVVDEARTRRSQTPYY